MKIPAALCILVVALVRAAEPPIPPVPDKQPEPPFAAMAQTTLQMLVPGFTLRELPVKLTSLNNIEYAPDGRFCAGGYDGRFHLLRDTDAVGYVVTQREGTAVVGTPLVETETELQIAQPGGAVARIAKSDIAKTEPMTISLMPAGLDKILTPQELRDLMTFLLKEKP